MLDPRKATERSVDSLQKLYAVVVALAIGQGIATLVVADRASNQLMTWEALLPRLPGFIAFLTILVPFFHGMNRHLDRCYLERPEDRQVRGALLFDFFVFFIQGSLLFVIAVSVGDPLRTFGFLGLLLVVDVVWGLISHWVHFGVVETEVVTWIGVNVSAIVIGFFVVLWCPSSAPRAWLLLGVAFMRTAVDYWRGWAFYFPSSTTAADPTTDAVSPSP